MITSNVHTHTTWCDGKNTPHEMAEAALALGFADLGFSSHAPDHIDPQPFGLEDEAAYRADIAVLRAEYASRLGILCGIEQDGCEPVDKALYDYVICSTHYLPLADGGLVMVDGTAQSVRRTVEETFGGDAQAAARAFYRQTVQAVRQHRPDIVGHFDLLLKFNSVTALFDEESAAYRQTALEALDAVLDILADYDGMLEVNTGAMARGHRTVPYPAPFLLKHAAQRKARVIITSDCHSAETLNYAFDVAERLVRQAGFKSIAMLRGGKFVDVAL